MELAAHYGFTARSIVLRADKDELLRRNAARPYTVPNDEFEQLYESVYNTVDPSELVIDSTGQNAEQTLASLRV
jgi:predicted kinase